MKKLRKKKKTCRLLPKICQCRLVLFHVKSTVSKKLEAFSQDKSEPTCKEKSCKVKHNHEKDKSIDRKNSRQSTRSLSETIFKERLHRKSESKVHTNEKANPKRSFLEKDRLLENEQQWTTAQLFKPSKQSKKRGQKKLSNLSRESTSKWTTLKTWEKEIDKNHRQSEQPPAFEAENGECLLSKSILSNKNAHCLPKRNPHLFHTPQSLKLNAVSEKNISVDEKSLFFKTTNHEKTISPFNWNDCVREPFKPRSITEGQNTLATQSFFFVKNAIFSKQVEALKSVPKFNLSGREHRASNRKQMSIPQLSIPSIFSEQSNVKAKISPIIEEQGNVTEEIEVKKIIAFNEEE